VVLGRNRLEAFTAAAGGARGAGMAGAAGQRPAPKEGQAPFSVANPAIPSAP
jgi:hypothetical protein